MRRIGVRVTVLGVLGLALATASSAVAADGDLATNFNGTGTLTGTFGSTGAQLFRGVVQPDGKLVVAGSREGEGVVARFNPNGTPDASFGISGTGYTIVDSGATTGGERLRAVALQGNQILAVGDASISGGSDFVLARLNSDGNLDNSFDGPGAPGNGVFRINAGAGTNASGSAIAADGTGLVFGGSVDQHPLVYRLTDTGALDTTFNTTGHMTFDFPGAGTSFLSGLAVQPSDSKIIAVGRANNISSGIGVARITTGGLLDTSGFASPNGVVSLTPPTGYMGGAGADVAFGPSGQILVVGFLTSSSGPPFGRDPAIAAVTSAGALDTAGFGAGTGYAVIPLPGQFDQAGGIAVQPDGKLLIGGSAGDSGTTDFLAARFSSTGVLDTSFAAPTGYTTTDIGGTAQTGTGVTLSGTGVAYVAGTAGSSNFGIAAYQAVPPAPPTLTGTDPGSGADNNNPKVIGAADPGTTVSLFTNAGCTGPPAASGSASSFASPGLAVSVADNSTTTFHATASWDGGTSACSASSVTYAEVTPPPQNSTAQPTQSAKKKCKKHKKRSAAASKKCKKKK